MYFRRISTPFYPIELLNYCMEIWFEIKTYHQLPFSNIYSLIKSALSGQKILATESLSKIMKNVFYIISNALFFLEVFKLWSWFLGHVTKRLDKKGKVNFKFYDVTAWLTSNCNTHIAQYLEKWVMSNEQQVFFYKIYYISFHKMLYINCMYL